MLSDDIAEEIRSSFPGTEEIIVQYLSGYLVDDAGEDEDVLAVARYILESVARGREDVLQGLMAKLQALLADMLEEREAKKSSGAPKLTKLEKVMDMSKSGAMSNTLAFTEGVDLESINKGK
jgi:ATP-binding cassette, subfamily F, member 3